jgi:hypothetical protein
MSSPEHTGAGHENRTHRGELNMTNTITARLARYIALPMVSAGIIGGAALGMAGMASAATYSQPSDPHFNAPSVKAHPAPGSTPGWHNHHGQFHIENLMNNGYHR